MILIGSLPVQRAGLFAQSFIGNLNPFTSPKESFRTTQQKDAIADDTLKILAIMVDFQEDADGTTFGNGKFGSIYSQNYGYDILDPLPHDQQYFESHLQFAKNYFQKVSKGKLEIEFTVLPETLSVPDRMRNYSPAPGSDDFTPLANFSVEAWTIADSAYPRFAFNTFDVFLIFHAGVGRDVTLPGSIGNERDLPSVYLSENAFKDIYGNDYEGIPVMGGTFNITNSMIIPETESRELETITGSFLFEITINGLICASIGSYLGLPDLFDTETGLSAIGRFGLMDGQSIFAYNGCYPPEPCPWSKIRLGWAEPVTVDIQNANVSLVTNLAATMSDTVILKVPLNSSEYYLIENRSRDANNDGSKVTLNNNGVVQTKTFLNDTTGYQSFDTDSLSGVITDVDEFDWAVPGNGIVIWHIDENVINEKIAENKVNTDKNRRGVDIEEADGVQEIGEQFTTIFGDVVVGEGSQFDFWYASNPAVLYQNRFAKDTRPNTLTNSGAYSLITIKDFSDISNRMSFKVEFGDSVIKPLFNYTLTLPNTIQGFSANYFLNRTKFNILAATRLNIVDDQNVVSEIDNFSVYKTPSMIFNDVFYTYGTIDSSLRVRITNGFANFVGSAFTLGQITSPSLIRYNSGEQEILLGNSLGEIIIFDTGSLPSDDPQIKSTFDIDSSYFVKKIAANESYFSLIGRSKVLGSPAILGKLFDSEGHDFSIAQELPIDLALTKDKSGKYISIVLTNTNNFYLIESGSLYSQFSVTGPDAIESIALFDLKQDGTNYIVVNNGNNIEVYNLTGSLADNFPFTDPEGIGFVGTPLAGDFEGDNASEIISVTKDGRIFAIDGGTGKVVPGFPISCGGSVSVTPVLYNANGKTNLAVLNDENILSAWSISSVEGKLYWSEEYGNPQNTSFVDAAESTNRVNEFFPANRAYNYPNPVYEGTTNIRYYVSEDSKINIKIFDLAGDYVAELNDNAQGGMDNETVWDVTNIQSGVYFARIEASSTSGKTEQAVIKIAIVK